MTPTETSATRASMHVTFVMSSEARHLPIVRATVAQLASVAGCDEAESRAVTLAIDEALANVIRHAYHGRADGSIELRCQCGADELQFQIRDTGDPPDPACLCAREIGSDKIGGLGTHIIKDVMDSVSYRTSAEGNWFTAAKRLRRPA
jgi:anti-sigma regulatory factor (Ser/Thr protein kinase)